jgi:antitoxin component YwqK of YwqJK toxin-antitoxin module
MEKRTLFYLNFVFFLVSFNLFGLTAQEIDSKIKEAKSFNDFFWVGNESTLFLKSDKKETFTGWAKAYYPTHNKKKQIRKITNYQKGRPFETIVWKPNGSRCKQTNLKDGNGQELHWHTNGKKRENSNYKNGLANGKFTLWYPNGQVEEKGEYLDGSLSGKVSHFDPKGKLVAEGTYKEGYPQEGTSVQFLGFRGKIKYTYEKGIKHGPWIWWNTKWRVQVEGIMHQGKPKGATTYFTYHKNGKKQTETNIVKGKDHGPFRKWDSSGKILIEGEFKNGLKHGDWKMGPVKITYENDKIIKKSFGR